MLACSVSSVHRMATASRHGRRVRSMGSLVAVVLGASVPAVAIASPPEPDPRGVESTIAASEGEPGEDEEQPTESLEKTRQEVRVEEAERHYVEGMALFNRGQYREAAAEFERSYAAIPAARTLYSIGLSYERAGQTIPAIEASERYLALPDCTDPGVDPLRCAEQRTEVGRTVDRLRRFVGELQLELAPGVELREVRVGGRVVPIDEFPLLLMPGPTEVELYGRDPDDYRVRIPRIVPGEAYVLRVSAADAVPPPKLDADPDPRPRPPDPPRDPAEEQRRRALMKRVFWGSLGVTVASGAATGALGGVTQKQRARFNELKCANPCPPEGDPDHKKYPEAAEARFESLKLTTNVMIGVSAALGVATVVVGVLAFSRRDKSARRAHVRLTGTGLSVRF